jgi:hypothetical protein
MHEASLQALEATTKRTSGKAVLSWSGAWDGVLADYFLTRKRPGEFN